MNFTMIVLYVASLYYMLAEDSRKKISKEDSDKQVDKLN